MSKVQYKVEFTGTWTAADHPVGYPGAGTNAADAHFSQLTGATFPSGGEFFTVGGLASPGVKAVAEVGSHALLEKELGAANYLSVASSAGGAFNPWKNEITVEADADHSYLGIITMIAPSPDWFTGASAIELYDAAAGTWKDTITYEARAYDAGTDAGATFTAADAPENPPKPVSVIACDGKAFCDSGAIKPVAAIKITKL